LKFDNQSGTDKRVVLPTNELQTVTLSTSNTKVSIRNYNNSPYVAFALIEVANLSSTQTNRETRLTLTNLSLENQSGVLLDGITWTSAEALTFLNPKTFENNSFFSQATCPFLYVLPGACLDGREALVHGVQSGGSAWEQNLRLNLVAPSTYTNHSVLIRVYEYKHVRVQNGEIKIY